MPVKRSWNDDQLRNVVRESKSIRSVLKKLGLVPAGGNYEQIKYAINRLGISTEHFTGKLWNKGIRYKTRTRTTTEDMLKNGSKVQSYKLKKRLFEEGLKKPECEQCGWSRVSLDGRIPVELDHINGDRYDNRISNLKILCPNCHSLRPTHRGRNKKTARARVVE